MLSPTISSPPFSPLCIYLYLLYTLHCMNFSLSISIPCSLTNLEHIKIFLFTVPPSLLTSMHVSSIRWPAKPQPLGNMIFQNSNNMTLQYQSSYYNNIRKSLMHARIPSVDTAGVTSSVKTLLVAKYLPW